MSFDEPAPADCCGSASTSRDTAETIVSDRLGCSDWGTFNETITGLPMCDNLDAPHHGPTGDRRTIGYRDRHSSDYWAEPEQDWPQGEQDRTRGRDHPAALGRGFLPGLLRQRQGGPRTAPRPHCQQEDDRVEQEAALTAGQEYRKPHDRPENREARRRTDQQHQRGDGPSVAGLLGLNRRPHSAMLSKMPQPLSKRRLRSNRRAFGPARASGTVTPSASPSAIGRARTIVCAGAQDLGGRRQGGRCTDRRGG